MLYLTCNFNSVTKIYDIFLLRPFLKVLLLKMAATILKLALSLINLIKKIASLSSVVLQTGRELTIFFKL